MYTYLALLAPRVTSCSSGTYIFCFLCPIYFVSYVPSISTEYVKPGQIRVLLCIIYHPVSSKYPITVSLLPHIYLDTETLFFDSISFVDWDWD